MDTKNEAASPLQKANRNTLSKKLYKFTEIFRTDKTGYFILLAAYIIQAIIILNLILS